MQAEGGLHAALSHAKGPSSDEAVPEAVPKAEAPATEALSAHEAYKNCRATRNGACASDRSFVSFENFSFI